MSVQYNPIRRSEKDQPGGVAGLDSEGLLNVPGVVYQDNLGEIGYPPEINEQGAIEALVTHRLNTPANLSTDILADGEIAVERDGTLEGLRIGDGVTAGGKRIASRQRFSIPETAFAWTTFATILEIPWTAGGIGIIYGRLRFFNDTGDNVQWRILTTTAQDRVCVLTNKTGSPATTELSFLGTTGSGVVAHTATMESVIVPSVVKFSTENTALVLEVRKEAHTSGDAILRQAEIIFEPI